MNYHSILPAFISVEFIEIAAKINLVLFLFNLLPIPPLDGFHVFSEIFPPLKTLEQYRTFGLLILFMIPGLGRGLYSIANAIIHAIVFV